MSEKPILFSGAMVRAILEGRKTQTRRVLKPQPPNDSKFVGIYGPCLTAAFVAERREFTNSLKYRVGDTLWVRENFATDGGRVLYAATDDIHELRRKKPSIHMPRWASRITLRVTAVKVERLQDISEDDAKAEGSWPPDGYKPGTRGDFIGGFAYIWESINGPGSWEANPWVAAYSFERVK